jgi:hypothetical protein
MYPQSLACCKPLFEVLVCDLQVVIRGDLGGVSDPSANNMRRKNVFEFGHNPAQTGGNSFLTGDSNPDGIVDGQDFLDWNDAKFTATGKWSDADWNADGMTDGQDFLIWNENKFQSSTVATPIVLSVSSGNRQQTHDSIRVQVNNDTFEDSSRENSLLAPLTPQRVDSVFAMNRRGEDHKDDRPKADFIREFQ